MQQRHRPDRLHLEEKHALDAAEHDAENYHRCDAEQRVLGAIVIAHRDERRMPQPPDCAGQHHGRSRGETLT